MNIGQQFAENKLYLGIKHFDAYPLTSEDMHEYYDMRNAKGNLFYTNLFTNGILNEPSVSSTSTGIFLSNPLALLVNGDISLIQSDIPDSQGTNQPLVPISEIETSSISEGCICILGWYQELNSSSTLRNYGGVNNMELENDLEREIITGDEETGDLQVSTRYQFRWFPILLDRSDLASSSISVTFTNRDATGSPVTPASTSTVSSISKIGKSFILNKPAGMTYAVESQMYLLPIIEYDYEDSTISNLHLVKKISVSNIELISSDTQPDYPRNGDRWYDTTTNTLKTYVESIDEYVDENLNKCVLKEGPNSLVPSDDGEGLKVYSDEDIASSYYDTEVTSIGIKSTSTKNNSTAYVGLRIDNDTPEILYKTGDGSSQRLDITEIATTTELNEVKDKVDVMVSVGTTPLIPGSSSLAEGSIYCCYLP